MSFNMGMFLGFVASTISSVIESIGDYNACARVVQVGGYTEVKVI